MPPLRFVWLVERGWIADPAERRLLAQLSPVPCRHRDGRRREEVAEIAFESWSGPAWVVPEPQQVGWVVWAARPLFEAQARLGSAERAGVSPRFIRALGNVYSWYEELWDGIFGECLDPDTVAEIARNGLRCVRLVKERLPYWQEASIECLEGQYADVIAWAQGASEPLDVRLGTSRSLADVPRPFFEAVLQVSSLDGLRSLLPPFTSPLGLDDWGLFRKQQALLRHMLNGLSRSASLEIASAVSNSLLAESTVGVTQVVTAFDWELKRIVATSERPVWECVYLFEQVADKPAKWFTPSRVRIIGGLLGLAYFDAFMPRSPHCPDCGRSTTPGRRGPRDVLCEACSWVRRQKSQAAKRSSKKSRTQRPH